jgi:hypothetical protein
MRVVEKRPLRVQVEFVDELSSGRNRLLAEVRGAVHFERDFEALPVYAGRLWNMMLHNDPYTVALHDLNGGPRNRAVIAPRSNRLER